MKASEAVKKKSPTSDEKVLLAMLVEKLKKMNEKLDSIVEVNTKILKTQEEFLQRVTNKNYPSKDTMLEPDAMALLSLPASLRKTAMVLYKLNEATAEDLANETKRLRAVESASANQLVRMGYLKKKREGRKVYFYIE
jgi:hypothetical protein